MPPRQGQKSHNISLSDHLTSQLEILAKDAPYEGSKSKVMEEALRTFLNLDTPPSPAQDVHDHVDAMEMRLHAILTTIKDQITTLSTTHQQTITHLQTVQQHGTQVAQRLQELIAAYDRLHHRLGKSPAPRRIWKWISF